MPNFIDFASAMRYYAAMGFTKDDVQNKIILREIYIGKPSMPKDGFITLNKAGQYEVCYNEA